MTLAVAAGRTELREGGQGHIRADIRGLAALYSGHMSAAELCLAGLLDGPGEELARADLLFGGARPWMPDMF
jgi:predicted acetyltransferase